MSASELTATTLREKTIAELRELSEGERKSLFDLRFRLHTGALAQTSALRSTRRNIARIETIIRERQLAQSASE